MFGRKPVFGMKSPSYQAQQAAMQPVPDADGVTRVFPKELWDDPKIGDFLRSAGMNPDDPKNIARDGDYFIAKFKAARDALNERAARYNAQMRHAFGHCNATPFLIIDQSIWDGVHGAFLYRNLDLVGYDDWNVLMMAADEATADGCGLAPHPGKLTALTAAMDAAIVRLKAKWEQAHESYGHGIMGRPGISREEFDRIEAEIISELLAYVEKCKLTTCEIALEQAGRPSTNAQTALDRASLDHAQSAVAEATDPERAAADAAIGSMSDAIGMDMNVEVSHIFSPRLWNDPAIGPLLRSVGLEPEMAGNKMGLFTNKDLVRKLRAAGPEDPMRKAALASGIGLAPYDVGAIGGFDEGKTQFQHGVLSDITRQRLADEPRKYAVFDLHMWSMKLMKGEIAVDFPGL
jgi:hypothetical protein